MNSLKKHLKDLHSQKRKLKSCEDLRKVNDVNYYIAEDTLGG